MPSMNGTARATLVAILAISAALYWRPDILNADLATHCRLLPGDPKWPSDTEWAEFNSSLGGRLIKNVPIGSPCYQHQSFGPYDQDQCEAIQKSWNLPETHTESSSSIMAPFFANDSCNPFTGPEGRCVVGAYNQYAARILDVEDIKKTVLFAANRNIRLTVRNSAHDYYGKSSGTGAISIWTKDLKSIKLVDYESTGYNGKAMKLGGGVYVNEAFNFAKSKNLLVLGGSCPTVGIARGYIKSAGTSLVASQFGLAADNVLEYEVVTAGGEYLEGGGGTYGVVASATVKAFPEKKTASATLTFSSDGVDKDVYYGIVKVFLDHLQMYTDAGTASTFILQGTGFSLAPMMGYGVSKSTIDKLIKPTLDALNEKNVSVAYNSAEYPTFVDAYDATNPFTPVNFAQIGGRIVSKNVASEKLVQAFRSINDAGSLVSGYNLDVSRQPSSSNSVHPAWRSASMSVVTGTFYDERNPQLNLDNQRLMTDTLIPALDRATSPEIPASYLNEADPSDPNWRHTFYGGNYGALKKIKKEFDPEDLFYARTAVGSDAWVEQEDGRLCRSVQSWSVLLHEHLQRLYGLSLIGEAGATGKTPKDA